MQVVRDFYFRKCLKAAWALWCGNRKRLTPKILRKPIKSLLFRLIKKTLLKNITEKYDAVIPIGFNCLPATLLRILGVRNASLPLDWVLGGTLESRLNLIVSGFKGFLEWDNFDFKPMSQGGLLGINRQTGLLHPHDFSSLVEDEDDHQSTGNLT